MRRDSESGLVAVLWIAAVVLVAVSAALAVRSEAAYRRASLQQAEAVTDVLAGSVGAALAFDDQSAMRQYLAALMRNPSVAAAGVYGPEGRPMALLARPGAAAPPLAVRAPGTQREKGRVLLARVVSEQGQRLGFVFLETTPESAMAFDMRHVGLVVLTLLALLLLGLITRAAARLARANARLSEEIEARTTAEAALRQSQKLEALGQLTGGIAHDFNNLLQAIHGAFELILGRAEDEATVRRWATNGLAAADRGASLTRQLLAFSRQQKLEMKPVVAAEVLGGMADLLTRTLGANIELVLDLDEEGLTIISDATQLELAVMNLAINARDAMPDGGRLTLRTRRTQIFGDAVLPAGRYLELKAIDTGEGMPLSVVQRAFDPFFTTKAVGKGAGLGLAQVYGLARHAGGDARIASTPGVGTTVTLFIREAAKAEPPPRAVQKAASAASRAGLVLLVDDDAAVREAVRSGLESRGFKVVDAGSGEAALAMAGQARPEAAVIDYAMPGMNGAQTAAELRRLIPALPIILASGYADTAQVERALGGSASFMRKPFDMNSLSEELSRLLKAA